MGNSIQLSWTDRDSIIRTITIFPISLKYSITGKNIKVSARSISPYVIMMGYDNPNISMDFTVDATNYDILNTLLSQYEITATVILVDFPEFISVSTEWYTEKVSVVRGQSFGTDRFNGNISLIRNYGI